jgi:hypothetical protein
MGRVVRRLSRPVKLRGFLVGPKPLRREMDYLFVMSCAVISITGIRVSGLACVGNTAIVQIWQRALPSCGVVLNSLVQRQIPAMKT